jgi:hypothetical protein
MHNQVRADPRDDPNLLALKVKLEMATENAQRAFEKYRDLMCSDERGTVTDEVRLHVEDLADAVMLAEGEWATRAAELGMLTRIRSRPLVRTDLWSGVLYLQDSVWDAQVSKVATEQELEELKHQALAALHEVRAYEVREKRIGSEDDATKESLKRARLVAKERIREINECKMRLDDLMRRATPADGFGFGFLPKRPVQKDFQLDPLDLSTTDTLSMSCRMVFH